MDPQDSERERRWSGPRWRRPHPAERSPGRSARGRWRAGRRGRPCSPSWTGFRRCCGRRDRSA
ncbi:hypothetical protein HBB16_17140 [Pseudonocardia sp. MCCB 268]|nr:hypothetical protein [Pseudonocardia cytotoxica]